MEESASNLINFYTNRIEELKQQLDKSNNKIEKIKEYCKEQRDIHFFPNPLVYDDILSIIDEENK